MRPSLVVLLCVMAAPFGVVALSSGCSFTATGKGGAAAPADNDGGFTTTTIDPTQPQSIVSPDGVALDIPANALQRSDGSAPQGSVTVGLQSNVHSGSHVSSMPGSFHGTDHSGNAGALASYGVASVHVTDSSGQALQMKPGMNAKLTIPAIPGGPSSVSLWSLVEGGVTWNEEGQASQQGTQQGPGYSASIGHMSSWAAATWCASGCLTGAIAGGGKEVEAQVTSSTCAGYAQGALAGGVSPLDGGGRFSIDGIVAPSTVQLFVDGAPVGGSFDVVVGNGSCTDLGTISNGGPTFTDGGIGSGSGSGGNATPDASTGHAGPGCFLGGVTVNINGTWTGSTPGPNGTTTFTMTCNEGPPGTVNGSLQYASSMPFSGDGCNNGNVTIPLNNASLMTTPDGQCILQGSGFNPNGIGWTDNVNFTIKDPNTMSGSAAPACSGMGFNGPLTHGG